MDSIANYVRINGTVSIFIEYGDGSFTNRVTYSTGSTPVSVDTGEYGNGRFRSPMILPPILNSHLYSIAIGDFNKDTELDISVNNFGTTYIDILLGNGSGMSGRPSSLGISLDFTPFVIAIGDLNNDRQSEIIVAYNDTDNVDIFVTYDPGSFTYQMTYTVGPYSDSVAVGDFNNGTRLDFVSRVENGVDIFLGYASVHLAHEVKLLNGNGSRPRYIASALE